MPNFKKGYGIFPFSDTVFSIIMERIEHRRKVSERNFLSVMQESGYSSHGRTGLSGLQSICRYLVYHRTLQIVSGNQGFLSGFLQNGGTPLNGTMTIPTRVLPPDHRITAGLYTISCRSRYVPYHERPLRIHCIPGQDIRFCLVRAKAGLHCMGALPDFIIPWDEGKGERRWNYFFKFRVFRNGDTDNSQRKTPPGRG
jgi:hypothetical protein